METKPDTLYNFLNIYETKHLKKKVAIDKKRIQETNKRNNYTEIYKKETKIQVEYEKTVRCYTNMFITQPTLKATLSDAKYSRTYNMYGTLVLEGIGMVFSSIKGKDKSGRNFGDFSTISGKDKPGTAGVLKVKNSNPLTFLFPLPTKIDKRKIKGNFYEITLNKRWKVKKIDTKGDLEIVRKKNIPSHSE